MKSKPITHGRLMDVLTELGYVRESINEHNYGFYSPNDDNVFFIRKFRRSAPARWHDIAHVRFQLDWRGQMTAREFDARLAAPATATA